MKTDIKKNITGQSIAKMNSSIEIGTGEKIKVAVAAASIANTLYVRKSVFSRKRAIITIIKQKITNNCKNIILIPQNNRNII